MPGVGRVGGGNEQQAPGEARAQYQRASSTRTRPKLSSITFVVARKNVISLRFDKRAFTYPRQYAGKPATVRKSC